MVPMLSHFFARHSSAWRRNQGEWCPYALSKLQGRETTSGCAAGRISGDISTGIRLGFRRGSADAPRARGADADLKTQPEEHEIPACDNIRKSPKPLKLRQIPPPRAIFCEWWICATLMQLGKKIGYCAISLKSPWCQWLGLWHPDEIFGRAIELPRLPTISPPCAGHDGSGARIWFKRRRELDAFHEQRCVPKRAGNWP